MGNYATEQEEFWAGEFGNQYVDRNNDDKLKAGALSFFSKVIASTRAVSSVMEFGANIGINMMALKQLLPGVDLSAIEINSVAVNELKKIEDLKVYHQSILEFSPEYTRDLVFTRGVLIHINPDSLPQVYEALYKTSKKYILIAEYYNPRPAELKYREHSGKLFKRDFAGEMLDKYKDLRLIDYGFIYHRDINFPQDDINWFLLEKSTCEK